MAYVMTSGIDFTAPAVDIIDELVERWMEAHPGSGEDGYELANAFAERVFTKRAKPLAAEHEGRV